MSADVSSFDSLFEDVQAGDNGVDYNSEDEIEEEMESASSTDAKRKKWKQKSAAYKAKKGTPIGDYLNRIKDELVEEKKLSKVRMDTHRGIHWIAPRQPDPVATGISLRWFPQRQMQECQLWKG